MNNAAKPRILLVEDDLTVQNLVSTALDLHGYVVSKVCNGQAAIMDAVSHGPSLIMLRPGLPTLTVSRSSRRSKLVGSPHYRHFGAHRRFRQDCST